MQTLKLTKKYETYPEYKDSGVEWLGKIPKGWRVEKNKVAFSFKKEVVGERKNDFKILSLTLKGVIPRDMENNQGKFPADYATYQIAKRNDLVMCLFDMDVTPRTVGYVGETGLLTSAYRVFQPKKDICTKFYYYYQLMLDDTKELLHFTGGLRNSISKEFFLNLSAPIPSFPDQEKIAKYLDEKTSSVDKIIEKKERQIELLKEKRITCINQTVTKGLDPNVEFVESDISWIGKIPKRWQMRKIFHLFKIIGSGTTPDDKYLTNSEVGIPWVNTGDLTDSYIELPSKKVKPEALQECSALKLFSKNAVIIAMYGATIGKLGIPQFDFCTNQACCVLEGPSKFISERFIYFWLLGNKKYIIEMGVGGGQPNINKDIVKSLKVSLPPKSIQDEIVVYLDKKVSGYDKAIKSIQESIGLLREFKSSLISNVVTGKIKI